MKEKCRHCGQAFQPKPWQVKKGDFLCPGCNRKYCQKWREKRREQGLPASGSKTWDEKKKQKWQKEYYSRPDVQKRKALQSKKYREDPKKRIKAMARWYLNRQKKRRKIKSQPCAFCGEIITQAHHLDYNKPLLVVWLCWKCHQKLHYEAKAAD